MEGSCVLSNMYSPGHPRSQAFSRNFASQWVPIASENALLIPPVSECLAIDVTHTWELTPSLVELNHCTRNRTGMLHSSFRSVNFLAKKKFYTFVVFSPRPSSRHLLRPTVQRLSIG